MSIKLLSPFGTISKEDPSAKGFFLRVPIDTQRLIETHGGYGFMGAAISCFLYALEQDIKSHNLDPVDLNDRAKLVTIAQARTNPASFRDLFVAGDAGKRPDQSAGLAAEPKAAARNDPRRADGQHQASTGDAVLSSHAAGSNASSQSARKARKTGGS